MLQLVRFLWNHIIDLFTYLYTRFNTLSTFVRDHRILKIRRINYNTFF